MVIEVRLVGCPWLADAEKQDVQDRFYSALSDQFAGDDQRLIDAMELCERVIARYRPNAIPNEAPAPDLAAVRLWEHATRAAASVAFARFPNFQTEEAVFRIKAADV